MSLKSTGTSTVLSTAAPRRLSFTSPLTPAAAATLLPWPTRRLSKESTRRVVVHGLKLPGEAQPMSVRRCNYRHWHTPTLAAPSGVRATACRPVKAESQLQSESLRPSPPPPPPPTPSQTRRQRPPWTRHKPPESMEKSPHPVPTPSADPTPHFFPLEKSAKKNP